MTGIEVIDSKAERDRLADRTDVLDKVGALATLPGYGEATTAQVAAFYEVSPEAIRAAVTDHREELEGNGYRVLRGQTLRDFKSLSPNLGIKGSRLALWSRRAVLNLGMLLRDSLVAQAVRRYLLDAESAVHEATVNRSPEHVSDVHELAEGITSLIANWVSPRFDAINDRLGQLEARLDTLETNEDPPATFGGAVPVSTLASVLGVPLVRNGRALQTGVSVRDGKPWARYGGGRSGDFIDRGKVIRAYAKLLPSTDSQ